MSNKLPKRLAGFMCPPGYVLMLVVPHSWGKGETIAAAAERVRQAGGGQHLARGPVCVYLSRDPDCGISEMGGLTWHPADPKKVYDVDENQPFLIYQEGE